MSAMDVDRKKGNVKRKSSHAGSGNESSALEIAIVAPENEESRFQGMMTRLVDRILLAREGT